MAKALIGYMNSDLRTPAHLTADNARLRARVRELEGLLLRLSEENDRLSAAHAAAMLDLEAARMSESMSESMSGSRSDSSMQPA